MAIDSLRALRPHAYGMIGLLTIQYLLGMATNLFVTFPSGLSEKNSWLFAWRQPFLALHMIVGTCLLIGTLTLVVRAIKTRDRVWTIASVSAGVAIVVAYATGSLFVSTQSDTYSYLMATGFIVAILAYFWGLYQSK